MSSFTPFEVARSVGDTFGQVLSQQRDVSSIDKILSDANEQGSEEGMKNAMSQILKNISPRNQKNAMEILSATRDQILNKSYQKTYENLGTSIEETSSTNPFMKQVGSILRSNLPPNEKNDLIKNIGAGVTLRTQQQARLERDSLARRLRDKVKSIDTALGKARLNDRPALLAEKKILDDQLDELYNLGETLDELPKERKSAKAEKEIFDLNNPDHAQFFIDLDEKYKGNKKVIEEKLRETYDFK
jgi:hypothetical protein